MTSRKHVLLAIGVAAVSAVAQPLQAQTKFGGQLSFANNANFGIGARLTSDFSSLVPSVRSVSLIASFDYFFPGSNVTYWELNGNAVYRINISGARILPYVGGGLDIAHAGGSFGGFGGSATRVGLNLVGGTWFQTYSGIRPFLELRAELAGGEQFLISGGILF